MADPAILAFASVSDDIDARHIATFGKTFRRIGRYVKLAQLGAVACMAGVDRGALGRIGVFLGSGLGNTADIVPLAEGILHPHKPWSSPMAFAGSVGNAAAFYVARTLALDGPNVTVSQEEISFEGALLEAKLALAAGVVDHALVGGVDVRTGSDAEQRERIAAEDLPGDITEGAGFLLLGPGSGWRVEEVWIGAADALLDSIPEGATVLRGWRMPGATETRLVSIATALALVDTLERSDAEVVVHVQRTVGGVGARVRLHR